jgi:dissimilatory sulfite reductase (desulfoviridin) alpha/beta subunit
MAIDFTALKGQGFLPQKQKDRYSVRLKVVGGNLSTAQLKSITEAADLYGDGHIHLTSRQAVEIPNVRLESLEELQALLARSGTRNVILGPKVRTVTACQGVDTCKWGCIGTFDLALELTDRYYGQPLPSKFRLGVTGCRNNCMRIEENDLGIKGAMLVEWTREPCDLCGACAKACRAGAIKVDGALDFDRSKCLSCGRCVRSCHTGAWSGRPSYNVFFGGRFGNSSDSGRQLLPIIEDRATLIKALDAAVDFYGANGLPGQRFRTVIERVGWDVLARTVAAAIAG